MPPDEPTDEESQQQLPEDNGTPFQPAGPSPDTSGPGTDPAAQATDDSVLDDTHPVTDTGLQPEEQYDEGTSGAAEAQEPAAGNAVTGFDPPASPDDGAHESSAPGTSDDVSDADE